MLPAGFGAATVAQLVQKIRARGVAYLPVNREGPYIEGGLWVQIALPIGGMIIPRRFAIL
jgi:hypothetical protein